MSNKAAWIPESKAQLKVDDAPVPSPSKTQVIVKVGAVAINPVDWKIQDTGMFMTNYPNVLGEDVAGVIEATGDSAGRLKEGQRVMVHCTGLIDQDPAQGAFQQYVKATETVTAPIPNSMSFEQATVLPLAISTAAAGLYSGNYLNLPYPQHTPKPANKSILIWGGSGSVGCVAIQLAKASGVTVVTTASQRNHEFVKAMGADHVLDYNSSSVGDDAVALLQKAGGFAGVYDAISSPESSKLWFPIAEKLGGGPAPMTLPPGEGVPSNVKAGFIFATNIVDKEPEIADAVWRKFVPDALASGQLKAKPDPMVVGTGLDKVQAGFEAQKKGVSAQKVVVKI